ncbi:MAG: YtxH domain-containing protein [Candidatus Eisenbacteria bacterium]|nr:YtxH domain-containing protein [Candidatus Eisenbacteria bacterium]
MSEERNEFAVLAASFLAGAIAGAVAGLLLAPKSGRETREDLRGLTHDLGEKAGHAGDAARGRAEHLVERASEALQAAIRTYREARGPAGPAAAPPDPAQEVKA